MMNVYRRTASSSFLQPFFRRGAIDGWVDVESIAGGMCRNAPFSRLVLGPVHTVAPDPLPCTIRHYVNVHFLPQCLRCLEIARNGTKNGPCRFPAPVVSRSVCAPVVMAKYSSWW